MSYKSVLHPEIFAEKNIIVTGGGSGIGRCTAHELASLGAQVILIGRKQEKLNNVSAEIQEAGGKVLSWPVDIRDEEGVTATIKAIVEQCGVIHGLVNNAGGQFPSPMEAISGKGFEAVVATNLTGGFLMSREVYNQSMKINGGAIVNITADNWNGMPGMAHSGAARAGMVNLTKTAAFEWGHNGVRVNAVAPGWIASSGMDTYDGQMKKIIPTLKKKVPLKRLATESEVSSVISFLLSDGAAFINGETIRIDGGAPLGSAAWPTPSEARNVVTYNGFHLAELPDVLKEKEEA